MEGLKHRMHHNPLFEATSMAPSPIRRYVPILLLVLASYADGATTFKFQKPTRTSVATSTATVPNDFVFDEIDDLEANILSDIRAAIQAIEGITWISPLPIADFPNPTVQLSGSGQEVTAKISGLRNARIEIRYRPPGLLERLFCGTVSGEFVIKDFAVSASYDYFSGGITDVTASYSDLDVDVDCSNIIGDLILGLVELLGIVDFDDIAASFIENGASSFNGRFANLFSLNDAVGSFEETGLREIRQTADDALMILGGVRSAVACFIANQITEELISRLALTAAQEIDDLRRQLSGLPGFISSNLPAIPDFVNGNLVGAVLGDFLIRNLPDVKAFLLRELEGVYAVAVGIVDQLETLAIEALTALVNTDFEQLFGGVNARLSIQRSAKIVTFDAFHTAPASFVGRAEAVAPCWPTYTIPSVENAAEYLAYNSLRTITYSAPIPTNSLISGGLLFAAQVKNEWGLYSYGTAGTIQLFAWQDCGCTRENFVWPQCPVAGAPAPVPAPSRPAPAPNPVPVPFPSPVFHLPPTRPGTNIP